MNGNGEVVDADELVGQLRVLKASGVDGVMVDCWWGNVEAHKPQEYNWTGYRRLFQMIRELKLKLQVRWLNISMYLWKLMGHWIVVCFLMHSSFHILHMLVENCCTSGLINFSYVVLILFSPNFLGRYVIS